MGVTPSEHKEIKGLTKPSQNLRDHMTDLELIFTSLGEALTRREMAGNARKMVAKESEKKVVSSENFLKNSTRVKELPPEE